jgi:hypothetical protein
MIPYNTERMDSGAADHDRKGLNEQEASEQLSRYGLNRITSRHEITFLGIAKGYFIRSWETLTTLSRSTPS